MAKIIQFNSPNKTDRTDPPLFTLSVYADRRNPGEVVATFDTNAKLSRLEIAEKLDEVSWKAKNMAAKEGDEKGRVALIITQFENSIEFTENEAIPKTECYIQNLKEEFEKIIECLSSLESKK